MQSFALEHLDEASVVIKKIHKDSALQGGICKVADTCAKALILKGKFSWREMSVVPPILSILLVR